MLERLLEMKRAVAVYSAEKTIVSLTSNEWDIMQRLLRVLQSFEECTKACSKPNSCISGVIPTVRVLQRFLEKDDGDLSSGVKTMRAELLKALTVRFESRTMDKNFLLATAVDPRFKLKFLDSESHAVLIRETNRLKPADDEYTLVAPAAQIHEKVAKAQNHDDLWACFDEIIKDHDDFDLEQTVNNDVTSEVSSFLALPLQPRVSCPYAWWLTNRSSYPNLFRVASKYLSAPSSSVDSERVFSEQGNICTEKRSSLAPHKADNLLFLHHNLPRLQFEY